MKLQKVLNRKVKGKPYGKWRIAIPPRLVDKLGWAKGTALTWTRTPNGLLLRRASTPKSAKTPTAKEMEAHGNDHLPMAKRDGLVSNLHERGLVDREIAERLGVSIATVCRIRKRLKLPPNGHERKRDARSWDTEKARRLHSRGLADAEIAEAVGASRETVTKWRAANSLIRNGRPGRKPRNPSG